MFCDFDVSNDTLTKEYHFDLNICMTNELLCECLTIEIDMQCMHLVTCVCPYFEIHYQKTMVAYNTQ